MTPDELASLLDEARTGRRHPKGAIELTLADRLDGDEDDERGRLFGGLL